MNSIVAVSPQWGGCGSILAIAASEEVLRRLYSQAFATWTHALLREQPPEVSGVDLRVEPGNGSRTQQLLIHDGGVQAHHAVIPEPNAALRDTRGRNAGPGKGMVLVVVGHLRGVTAVHLEAVLPVQGQQAPVEHVLAPEEADGARPAIGRAAELKGRGDVQRAVAVQLVNAPEVRQHHELVVMVAQLRGRGILGRLLNERETRKDGTLRQQQGLSRQVLRFGGAVDSGSAAVERPDGHRGCDSGQGIPAALEQVTLVVGEPVALAARDAGEAGTFVEAGAAHVASFAAVAAFQVKANAGLTRRGDIVGPITRLRHRRTPFRRTRRFPCGTPRTFHVRASRRMTTGSQVWCWLKERSPWPLGHERIPERCRHRQLW
ncbi:hypothetical protein EBBID32_5910 [Sphingobium indicum BiD32]|uniref:Uncharacterized protein n=1 Tax=Sphingobium indicum BiD32 TaxID=1301087 RepID=N1MLE4_9SPHN|nr:hypothetical protein EBBID32_5910 [Sphingobium indicum BiD32]